MFDIAIIVFKFFTVAILVVAIVGFLKMTFKPKRKWGEND